MDASKWFLETVFGADALEDRRIAVVAFPSKAVHFAPAPADSQAFIGAQLDAKQDVYVGGGLVRPGIKHGRGKADDVVAITAVWADVDFGPGRKKQGTPPNQLEALRILDRVGVKPSLVVHSGHGLQPWWLLSEPMTVNDGAARFLDGWGRTIRACAQCLDYTVDSVHDLARVMRVPGTTNWSRGKGDVAVPVTLLERPEQPARYHFDDLEAFIVPAKHDPTNKATMTPVQAIIVDATRQAPADKLEAALANDPRFKKTWNRNRTDLSDDSPSGYDFALANWALVAGWSDQDTADLLIAFRRKHGLDMGKALRRDYLSLTIGHVKADRAEVIALSEIAHQDTSEPITSDRERQVRFDKISKLVRVKVTGWLQHGNENADYVLQLDDGRDVLIGSIDTVTNQRAFRNRVVEVTGRMIRTIKGPQWENFVELLMSLRQVIPNEETERLGQLRSALHSYLSTVTPRTEEEWPDAFAMGDPFILDGLLNVNTEHLRQHMARRMDMRMSPGTLRELFRVGGFQAVKRTQRVNNRPVCRWYWQGPLPSEQEKDNDA